MSKNLIKKKFIKLENWRKDCSIFINWGRIASHARKFVDNTRLPVKTENQGSWHRRWQYGPVLFLSFPTLFLYLPFPRSALSVSVIAMDEEYDGIVLGRGLKECIILSGLVSVDGLKALSLSLFELLRLD